MTITASDQCNRLLLYAKLPVLQLKQSDDLIKPLLETGFIGEACHDLNTDFLCGEHFLSLITFLGCSPNVALSPAGGEGYCFIRFHEMTEEPRLYMGKNTPVPRCRSCRQLKKDWQDCQQVDYCDRCSLAERTQNLNWRKQGALSSLVIEIMNIYPHEAVPSSQLLTSLQKISGIEWGYAYLQA